MIRRLLFVCCALVFTIHMSYATNFTNETDTLPVIADPIHELEVVSFGDNRIQFTGLTSKPMTSNLNYVIYSVLTSEYLGKGTIQVPTDTTEVYVPICSVLSANIIILVKEGNGAYKPIRPSWRSGR